MVPVGKKKRLAVLLSSRTSHYDSRHLARRAGQFKTVGLTIAALTFYNSSAARHHRPPRGCEAMVCEWNRYRNNVASKEGAVYLLF